MGSRFNPNDRATVRYIEDEELAYVMQRYREVRGERMCLLACLLFGVLWLANAGVGLSTWGDGLPVLSTRCTTFGTSCPACLRLWLAR